MINVLDTHDCIFGTISYKMKDIGYYVKGLIIKMKHIVHCNNMALIKMKERTRTG